MRYIKQGVVRDSWGNIVIGATISVYLAGTTTPASIYAADTGGTAVNSVATDSRGDFVYYVDDDFCLRARKAGYKILITNTATLLHSEGKKEAKTMGSGSL